MEGEVEICKKSFISSTNWTILNGSLDDSISFETPVSSINEDFHDSKSLKHPSAVLTSSSSDSAPCEIRLSFEQRHEIRQVYVRSSARIYEIYYETGPDSNNEYLCTVRCGVATKEDAPLATNDSEETTFEHVERSNPQNDLMEDKVKSDSSSSTNTDEDGWVEVKVSETRNPPEFYEATAEISDSNPCSSITLRLLSLETKGFVQLEEIYIFGDPVEVNDSDDNSDPKKKSTESSVMAMLVPTLLQLSKTGTSKRSTQDKNVSDVRQEEEVKPVVPGNRIERVLDELVFRVGRMEAFCSRFEEKMLKPICNIETRLERLEKQLELVLSSKLTESQNDKIPENQESESESKSNPPGMVIRAPEFSNEQDEEEEGDDGYFVQNDQKDQGLVIRAPEFSNEQDEEEEGDDGQFEVPLSKPCLSIDDALSMALAGFISSSQSPQINHSWVVKVPEYSDSSASSLIQVGPTATPDDSIRGPARVWEVELENELDPDPDISLGNEEDLMRPPPQVPSPDEVERIRWQNSNLTVDFELPVLDVKFDLGTTSNCSLETLLGDDALLEMKEEENNQNHHLEDSVFEVPLVEIDNLNTGIPVIEIPDSP